MSVTPLPSTMCSVLLLDGNEDRVLWIKDGTVERVELREDLKIEKGSIG